jgi:hypothetical protein
MPGHAFLQPLDRGVAVFPSIRDWVKGGLIAVTFILAFKFVAQKSNVPALTSVAGKV